MSLTVAQLVARLSADTSGFYKGMAVANASMVRTGGIVGRVAAGVGIATVAMGYMALRSAGDFQQSMNILKAVSGSTGKELESMRHEAILLGADLKLPNTSARDAADAMVELSKGGLTVRQILTATRGTIQLSIAANMDLADSAQIVARGLKAFNLPGTEATTIANLLAAGANRSTAEITDLALGIQNASTQFTGANYSVQDLVVALAELADKGLNGELAGTALKVMLQRLESPTTKAAAMMKKLGVNIADAGGNIRPLPVIIGQFERGLAKLSPIQQQQALNAIFGARANAAMLKLVQQGTDGWRKYSHAIVGTNAAQQMAEARTKGFNGAIQGFYSAMETFAVLIGTTFLPVATRAVQWMSRFVESLNTTAISNFISGLGSLIGQILGFVFHSTTMLTIIGALLAGFTAFRILLGIANMINGVRMAMIAMNAAMISSPVILIIAAIAALAAGLYILYQRSATARRIMGEVAAFMRSTFGPAVTWLKGLIGDLANWIGQKFNNIRNFIHSNSAQIKSDLSLIWNAIAGIIRTVMGVISGIFHTIWPALKAFLQGTWNNMKIIVQTAINAIKDVVNIVMGLLHGDWGRAWRGLRDLVKDVLQGLVAIVTNTLSTVGRVAYEMAKAIGQAIWNGIKQGASDIGSKLGRFLKDQVTGALNDVKSLFGISSPSKVFAEKVGKPIAEGIIQGFLLGTAELPTKMSERLRTALQSAQTVVSAQMSIFQEKFSRFTSYIDTAFDAITSKTLTPAEKLLQGMISAHDQAALQKGLDDANKAVSDAQANLSAVASATYETEAERNAAIVAAQQQLTDAIATQKEAQYQIEIASLQKTAEQERLNYEARRNLQKQHLDDTLAYYELQMQKHPERAEFWQKRINRALRKYGITYKATGTAMGKAFAQGLREAEKDVEAAIKSLAKLIEKYLKLNSPAEEGPLSDLDRWWEPFARTLIRPLDGAPIRSAALALAGQARVGTPTSGSVGLTPVLPRSPGAAGSVVQYVFPISGNTFLSGDQNTARELAANIAPHLTRLITV